ncbi:Tripartite motif-containing protein 65 [Frankliniella fusca]|uniref:Tripartite motif-containing protein 65 n=1 Tax=Frankliniella fusca TaxID=407009 RepID=A0AAE1HEP9_9NEOP|nr:Tripartite motif-containing protein 65 [Frankliniella fusca]
MLDLDMGMPNTWRAISCAEISQLFKKAFTIFRSFFMTIIFFLPIFPAHPYHLTKRSVFTKYLAALNTFSGLTFSNA